ncbi:hypothetical protein X777_16218 [Ooceraea biroi]|uniref:Sepiapterin reductase n=1 Tax=Ooceraea biroi TaxID=2015173 RepID=A0A026VVI5_OOCBI|nr:hypothetical protein X777_16218 [Ooceraea biroi]
MSVEALSGKVFLVVTGASRGIGRQIALTFGSLLEKGSHMLLLARDFNALCEVKKSIPPIVNVDAVRMDLSKATKTDLEGESEFLLSKPKSKRHFHQNISLSVSRSHTENSERNYSRGVRPSGRSA